MQGLLKKFLANNKFGGGGMIMSFMRKLCLLILLVSGGFGCQSAELVDKPTQTVVPSVFEGEKADDERDRSGRQLCWCPKGQLLSSSASDELQVMETNVEFKTPDGTCDAAFFHPKDGCHPGVLIWPDSQGLRPALRQLGRRIAAEGYSVLVPNHLYRSTKAPVFDESFDIQKPENRERYFQIVEPLLALGAVERDAVAYVAFLDEQPQVNKEKKIGVHGYCLGGAFVLRTAAAVPERVGAGASFHGGFLVTDQADSPHLLAPKIKARLYIAIASDDDQREPKAKDQLHEVFVTAKVPAEIEVYAEAKHGWCVPDNEAAADSQQDADRAFRKLVALYKEAL